MPKTTRPHRYADRLSVLTALVTALLATAALIAEPTTARPTVHAQTAMKPACGNCWGVS